ncbi:MAG: aminotransferase class V-fold PLP-dependent enzyme [Proteobacteria bacterium]|nr:aminotransferase class V-fold PLP-dependent enzyme [Pseudomonadota bacterium]
MTSNHFGRAIRDRFFLEDGIAFLNHGAYGATPRAVLAAADEWRRRMEAQPARFMQRELPGALRRAAAALGAFVGARGEDLVFVDNATTGVNAVLRSLALGAGDEVSTTTHVYGAVRMPLRHVCAAAGARLVEADVPFPLGSEDEIYSAVAAALTSRTRLLVIDHVTSSTALIFPVARLVALARSRGVRVLIDGAHAPGMLDLDIAALGCDFYVGNCHKWLFAPKGCGFLWAARDGRDRLHPAVISHGYGKGFLAEFDWTGTRDHSAWLAVVAALEFIARFGAAEIRAHNHDLLLRAARLLGDAWGTPAGGPPSMLGSMATIRLPLPQEATQANAVALHARLFERHGVEVPIVPFAGALWARISAQIYNDLDDYRRLAEIALA